MSGRLCRGPPWRHHGAFDTAGQTVLGAAQRRRRSVQRNPIESWL